MTVTRAIANSDGRPRIVPLVCHTCRRRDEQKRLTAYSGGNVGIGSRQAEPKTVVYIEFAMREHKESFLYTLHGAHAVDGTRRAKVVGAAAPSLYAVMVNAKALRATWPCAKS